MKWVKDTAVAIGGSALIATLFSYAKSDPDKFTPWFAVALACSLANGLIMTATAAYKPDRPEFAREIAFGYTIHPPRIARLKHPGLAVTAIVLAGALAWIVFR